MSRRTQVLLAVALLGVVGVACNRPLFEKPKPAIERMNPDIPSGRYKVLVSIAGGNARYDLQMSVTVRQRLIDSGYTVIKRPGRWETQADAVRAICAPGQVPPVDGVVFTWYNRLELRDCVTETAAYEVEGGGSIGITDMADRLIKFLRR
jgi:hypothetical protein